MRIVRSGAVRRRDAVLCAVNRSALVLLLGVLAVTAWLPGQLRAAKLVAEVYPGAVPAVTGKRADGSADPCTGRCFLTKDPIEKVKAFYEKKLGPMTQGRFPYNQRGYGILLEYARRSEEGTEVAKVEIFTLSPARLKIPKDNAKRGEIFRKNAFGWGAALGAVHPLAYATDWGQGSTELGPPYKPADVVALYEKYSHLNSSFFVRDVATGKDRAQQQSEQFSERWAQLMQQSMMGNLSNQAAISQAANREGDKIAAADAQDDPEFNRIMHRKPALRKKYTELAQKTQQLMMAGKDEEADRTMDEADRLLRSDPEMAALMRRYDARDQQREAVGRQAKAQGQAAETQGFDQLAKKRWELAVQTLNATAKEGYATYITVDYALEGKGVERDRAKLRAMNDGPNQGPPEMEQQSRAYRLIVQEQGLAIDGETPEQVAAAVNALRAKRSGGSTTQPASAPAAAQAPAQQPGQGTPPAAAPRNDVQEAAKKSLNLLKKLW